MVRRIELPPAGSPPRAGSWGSGVSEGMKKVPRPLDLGSVAAIGVGSRRGGCSARNLWIKIVWPGADPASLNPNRSFMI